MVHIKSSFSDSCADHGYHNEASHSKMLSQNIDLFLNYKSMSLSVGKI